MLNATKFLELPVDEFTTNTSFEKSTTTVTGKDAIMFSRTGITADNADESKASRGFICMLRRMVVLLGLLVLVLHLSEQVRVAVFQGCQVG